VRYSNFFVIQLFTGSEVKLFAQMAEQQRSSEDAQQGIPAIPDPAALDQDQYGKLAQGASVGAGSGAAFGEHCGISQALSNQVGQWVYALRFMACLIQACSGCSSCSTCGKRSL
jgi:hypothetical protein